MSYLKYFYRPNTVSRKQEEKIDAEMEELTALWAAGDVMFETYEQCRAAATYVEMKADGYRLPANDGVQTRSQAAISEVFAIIRAAQLPSPAQAEAQWCESSFDDPPSRPSSPPTPPSPPPRPSTPPPRPSTSAAAPSIPPPAQGAAPTMPAASSSPPPTPPPQPPTLPPRLLTPPVAQAASSSPPPIPYQATPIVHGHLASYYINLNESPTYPPAPRRRPSGPQPPPLSIYKNRHAEDAANNHNGFDFLMILIFMGGITFHLMKYLLFLYVDFCIFWMAPYFLHLMDRCFSKFSKFFENKSTEAADQTLEWNVEYCRRHVGARVGCKRTVFLRG